MHTEMDGLVLGLRFDGRGGHETRLCGVATFNAWIALLESVCWRVNRYLRNNWAEIVRRRLESKSSFHRPWTWLLETIALNYIMYIVFAVLLDHRPKISEQFVSLRLVSFLLFFFFAAHHTWSHHPWQSLMLLILLVPYSLRFSGPQGRFGSDFLSSSGIMLVPGALQNLVVTSGKPMASSKVCFQLGQKQFCKLMSFSQVAVSRRLMKFFFID